MANTIRNLIWMGLLITASACSKGGPDISAEDMPGNATNNSTQDGVAPVITGQTTSQTVTEGNSVTISVTAEGDDPMTYTWTFNGLQIATSSSSYLISSVPLSAAGTYTVTVSNAAGTATSSPIVLTVNASTPIAPVPTITSHPASQSLSLGADANFSVTATSTIAMTYQWLFNGATIAGAVSSTLTVPAVTLASQGYYSVVISNASGTANSNSGYLTVTDPTPLPSGSYQLSCRNCTTDTTNHILTCECRNPWDQWPTTTINYASCPGSTMGNIWGVLTCGS